MRPTQVSLLRVFFFLLFFFKRTSVAKATLVLLEVEDYTDLGTPCPRNLTIVKGVVVGPFEEEEEGTGVTRAINVVKLKGEDPATPGPLPEGMTPGP